MTSDPQEAGAPDLASKDWDALWEVCADLHLPVHFHIGASLTSLTFYGQYFWPSLHDNMKPAVGGSMLGPMVGAVVGVLVATVFHVTRMMGMVVSAGLVYRWLARWRGWPRITLDSREV